MKACALNHVLLESIAMEDMVNIFLFLTRDTYCLFTGSGLTAYSALRKAGESLFHESVVIFGSGGLGLMALRLIEALGAKQAVVIDINANKRDGALLAGAMAVVDGGAEDAMQQVVQYVGKQPSIIIDFVGSEATANLGFQLLAKGGKLICVGLFGGAAPWALPVIAMRAITIQGNYVGTLQELVDLLDLVRSAKMAPIPIERSSLEQMNDSLDRLRHGNVEGRMVVVP
jgi:propanol-preferring alcohol dehydrogenase